MKERKHGQKTFWFACFQFTGSIFMDNMDLPLTFFLLTVIRKQTISASPEFLPSPSVHQNGCHFLSSLIHQVQDYLKENKVH